MEKIETPVIAGVGGAAVLAALLSVFNGGSKEVPQAPPDRTALSASAEGGAVASVLPNQDGPWRAICQEYAPGLSVLGSTRDGTQISANKATDYKTELEDELKKSQAADSAQSRFDSAQNKVDATKREAGIQSKVYAQAVLDSYQADADRHQASEVLHQAITTRRILEDKTGSRLLDMSRGYQTTLRPTGSQEGSSEVTVKGSGAEYKISVRKRLVGDLPSCIPPEQLGKLRLVIATLPDPDKTDMRLEFDRYVTALEEAASLRGYHYSGYWFPWRPRDNSPAPKKEDEVEAQLLREEQPGVLLFHNDVGERLVLLVVGETATSGINRMQMAQALAYRQQLIDAYPGRNARLVIVGPHFSGALPSLWEVLTSEVLAREPKAEIVIESGDVSSESLIHDFLNKCTTGTPTGLRCSFHSISISAAQKDKAAVDYLKSIGYVSTQIAELGEDESGFGDAESGLRDAERLTDKEAHSNLLKLTYPRELSAVRSLSDKQSERVAESGSKILSLSTTPNTVKLSNAEPLERDRPFIYANNDEITEISNALTDDVRLVVQKQIQCVLITGTNPLDRIYLLEYFHDKLPNVRLVVEDADELEINHPQFIDLTGTITISTFPTILSRVKLRGEKVRKSEYLSFSSVAAEEQFLAAAVALGDDPANDSSQQAGFNVSVVGENGFQFVPFLSMPQVDDKGLPVIDEKFKYDVQLFGPDSNKKLNLMPNIWIQLEQSKQIPTSFLVLSAGIYVFALFHFARIAMAEYPGAILKRLKGRAQEEPCAPHWAYGYRTKNRQLDSGRVHNLFVLNNQVFLLNLLLLCVTPALSSITALLKTLDWIFLSVGGLLVCRFGKEYFLSVKEVLKQPNYSVSSWKKWVLRGYFLLANFYLLAGVTFFVYWHRLDVAQQDWRRTLSLESGVSALVPIFAVLFGWTLWGLIQTRRAKWVVYRKIEPISRQCGPMLRLHQELHDAVTKIHAEIEQTSISWQRMVVLVAAVAVIAHWQWNSLQGLEPIPVVSSIISAFILPFDNFHWWFAVWGGIMLLVTLVLSAYQLYKIWSGLSGLLHRLENTSMKEAFEKLGLDDKVSIKIWDLGKAKMRYSELFLTAKCLKYIHDIDAASAVESMLNEYEATDFRGCQASLEQAEKLQMGLNRASYEAIAVLDGNSEVPVNSRLEAELRRYLVFRFVTFIRYVLLQMRSLMWFVVYGYFFACLSVKLYPFQGGKSLGDLLGLTFFIVLAMVGAMITGILRNPMLRLLEDKGSNPAGALQVIMHLATVGGVPLLALLAWQFPWIGQVAFSWLRPLWGAIH